MINLTEYLIQEMKAETYLKAAEKAKKIKDPRAEKFFNAYIDTIKKELDGIDSDEVSDEFNKCYKEDKVAIARLKSLSDAKKAHYLQDTKIKLLQIESKENYYASVYLMGNMADADDRACLLRKSFISLDSEDKKYTKEKFIDKIFKEVDPNNEIGKSNSRFTYISIGDQHSEENDVAFISFIYVVDDDKFLPVSMWHMLDDEKAKGNSCLDKYNDFQKDIINKLCKAINSSHKDI